jgi:hypothetical protein
MQTSSSVQTLLLEVLVVIELTTGAIEVVVVSVHFAPEYATAGLLIKSYDAHVHVPLAAMVVEELPAIIRAIICFNL